MRAIILAIGAIGWVTFLVGCGPSTVNPSFDVPITEAKADIKRMREDPRPAARPVVVLGGYADPGVSAPHLAGQLRKCLAPETKIVTVYIGMMSNLDEASEKLVQAVQEAVPSDDPACSCEVDVVAVSMGGLVARNAARTREGYARLKIANLYTLATPHLGARLAVVPTLESRVVNMRCGSAFLTELDSEPRDYAIVPYARLGDAIVGTCNTAPPGCSPWWLDCPPLVPAHLGIYRDPRIIADIARRLRKEEPLTHEPASPLPDRS